MDLLQFVIVLIVAVFVVWLLSGMCGKDEGYMSLPFAGGAVRSYAPDPHRIEDQLWRDMDEDDGGKQYPL